MFKKIVDFYEYGEAKKGDSGQLGGGVEGEEEEGHWVIGNGNMLVPHF